VEFGEEEGFVFETEGGVGRKGSEAVGKVLERLQS
jgi:hypothetical protein